MARPDLRTRSHCPHCEALLPRAALDCPSCGGAFFSSKQVKWGRQAARNLVERLSAEPWLQSSDRLSYVLHSRGRGFLREHGHRLREPVADFVESVVTETGELGRSQLVPHLVDTILRQKSSALAQLVEEAARAPRHEN